MSLPLIVGIAGAKRTGKSTVAAWLEREYGYQPKAFAAPVKHAALTLDPLVPVKGYPGGQRLAHIVHSHGWEWAKDHCPEVRRVLQVLGTDVGRRLFGEDVWVDLALSHRPLVLTSFSDVRFPNEVERVLDFGGIVFRLRRPAVENGADRHESEVALNSLDLPEVCNDGTLDDLYGAVRRVMETLTHGN